MMLFWEVFATGFLLGAIIFFIAGAIYGAKVGAAEAAKRVIEAMRKQ